MKKGNTKALEEASPQKSLLKELDALRALFRDGCGAYLHRVEAEIDSVREAVLATLPAASSPKIGASEGGGPEKRGSSPRKAREEQEAWRGQMHDLRDMLTLLRTLEISPSGRRKDLKKLESTVADLRTIAGRLR